MLQRLEKAVQTLGPRRPERTEAILTAAHGPSTQGDSQIGPKQPLDDTTTLGETSAENGAEMCGQEKATEAENSTRDQGRRGIAPSVSSSHGEGHGKIIRDHGRDTYVRRWFWDDGNTEVGT